VTEIKDASYLSYYDRCIRGVTRPGKLLILRGRMTPVMSLLISQPRWFTRPVHALLACGMSVPAAQNEFGSRQRGGRRLIRRSDGQLTSPPSAP